MPLLIWPQGIVAFLLMVSQQVIMGTKRGAAEMEGEEEEEEEEDGEGEGEEEVGEEGEGRERHQQREQEQDDGDEDMEEEDEDMEEEGEQQQKQHGQGQGQGLQVSLDTPKLDKAKRRKKGMGSDDEDDKAVPTPGGRAEKAKEEEDDEEENLEIELGKSHTVDPERMQAILAQFTTEQMSRYECYRRSGFQKANMRRLLQSVAGCPISMPMTIVMSGIAKMFVGELVEIGRTVMTERKETGPTRPCHIREAYRRLKLKGKVPLRTRPRLFH